MFGGKILYYSPTMIFRFPYEKLGFTNEEWTDMPNVVKRNIRDYYLNGRDRQATKDFAFYDTDFSIRRMEKLYNLRNRPVIVFRSFDFTLTDFPCE